MCYQKIFGEYNQKVAQILITKDLMHPVRRESCYW